MNELDDSWQKMLASAAENAERTGRSDVADYLKLKLTNDQMRQEGTRWLFDTAIGIAGEMNRRLTGISIEREDPHSFEADGAHLVGALLTVRYGVRSVMFEAGWPRTPKDGFIRGGALAVARIRHFGAAKANVTFHLKPDGAPKWHGVDVQTRSAIDVNDIAQHFRVFLGE